MGRLAISLLLVVAVCSAAAAAPPKPSFNVDFLIGWEGCYRPLEWTPVYIEVTSNLKKPFGGDVTVAVKQDEMTDMTVTRPIVLTPDLPLRVPLAVKVAFAAEDCQVAIHDRYGITRWSNRYSLWERFGGRGQLTAVEEGDLLVGLVGRPGFGLIHLPRSSRCTGSRRGPGQVYLKRKQTRALPWDWTGYASLDLLILYDVDYQQMNPHQAEAVAQWVSNGGKLLIVLGGRAPNPRHPVASLLPFRLGQVRQARISAATARDWGCEAGRTRLASALPCWTLPGSPGAGWQVLWTAGAPAGGPPGEADDVAASAPYFAHGPAGFGRVGVLACDPTGLGGRQRENLARFWVKLAEPLLDERQLEHATGQSRTPSPWESRQFELGTANTAANAVLEHLLNIRELRPLSIWVVIVLLLSLAVLIGPVDYFVLKRLDRLPLTWLTSATCVLLFTVAAYYGVRALRAGSAQVRLVSVVDAVSGSKCAWRTSYCGIFAPVSDKYELAGLTKDQWWSSVVSTRSDTLYDYNRRGTSRRVFCTQIDGGNLPHAVPINIWTMQCLVAEAPAEGAPFAARVRRDGNQVTVTVDNRSEGPIRDGCVRVEGDRVLAFGSVPGKAQREFTGRLARTRAWEQCVSMAAHGGPTAFAGECAYFAWGSLQRTRGIQGYLKRGGAVVCARYDEGDRPFELKKRRARFNHVQMARLVVFPEEGSAQ